MIRPYENAFYLRTKAQSSLRNVVLNKYMTMDNIQNINNCIYVIFKIPVNRGSRM
jgi:hypothetical protein